MSRVKSFKGGAEFFENPVNIIIFVVLILLFIIFIYYVYIWWVNKTKVVTDVSGNKVKPESSMTHPTMKEALRNKFM
jgi:hypothetical protein